ncbi:MAG: dihydrolipoyl dehydrogenase, partial [Gemmatimonadetes bacterium]|nr:dihydrolipoyl dehydrogenase [Gemmatimonadota bacterium]
QLGMKVAVVEAQKLGGVCNNWGCIPTKALLESAKYARKVGELGDWGVSVGKVELDLGKASKRAGEVAGAGEKGTAYLFKKNKIDHVQGWGRIAGKGKVEVDPSKNAGHGDDAAGKGGKKGEKKTLEAKNIIIATGSRPKSLPMLKIDGDRVWSSDHAVYAAEAPKSVAIIGAGAIGMEFADVFASFGSEVTVIEALDRVLPQEDAEASKFVARAYQKRGMTVMEAAKLEKAEVLKTKVKLTVKPKKGDAQQLEVERVLVAVGRAAIVDDIGLEKAGVKLENGFIKVDGQMKTTAEGIYAIGDCAKPPLLAHKASHEGIAAVEVIAGDPHAGVDYGNIPFVTYCHPEVASCGMTEEKAKEAGHEVEVGKFPFSANGRARTAGETEGFIKVVRDRKYGEVLGATIVGAHASELIGEFIVGRHLETTAEEMDRAMHPHPTLSEAIAEAALASLGHALHV